MGVVRAGLAVALCGPADAQPLRFAPAQFWLLLLASAVVSIALDFPATEAPREFEPAGFAGQALHVLALLFVSWFASLAYGRESAMWALATLLLAGVLVLGAASTLFFELVLPRWSDSERTWWSAYGVFVAWYAGIINAALRALGLGASARARLPGVLFGTVVLVLPFAWLQPARYWVTDYYAKWQEEQGAEVPVMLVAEEVFAAQPALLQAALAPIERGRPGVPELYFVAFAPYGEQDVFLKEALYSTTLFEQRFGAAGRSLTLANNPERVADLPLASVSNLEQALAGIGARMNADEDILFLFVTSHGSRDAELAVELPGLTFRAFDAAALAQMLQASGIRWRVLVISGCYSGSFLPLLQDDPGTLVLTASRADRNSFGCSDGAEFTYFGRAFFEQALNQTTSITEAFALARAALAEWEAREGQTPSEPQIASHPEIEAQLELWRATLPAPGAGSTADGG